MLEFMGWKDYRGRWDKDEIKADVLALVLVCVVVYGVYLWNQ